MRSEKFRNGFNVNDAIFFVFQFKLFFTHLEELAAGKASNGLALILLLGVTNGELVCLSLWRRLLHAQ